MPAAVKAKKVVEGYISAREECDIGRTFLGYPKVHLPDIWVDDLMKRKHIKHKCHKYRITFERIK